MIKTPIPEPSTRLSRFLPVAAVTTVLVLWLLAAQMQFPDSGAEWPLHKMPSNETCEGRPLEGTFVGEGDLDVFGVYFKWRTTQTFFANGTHDIDQVVLADPMGVVPELHCRKVPFITDEANCTVQVVRDDCMLAALNGLEVVREKGAWDPFHEALHFILVVQVPRISAVQLDCPTRSNGNPPQLSRHFSKIRIPTGDSGREGRICNFSRVSSRTCRR
jgi:hypothetical protein